MVLTWKRLLSSVGLLVLVAALGASLADPTGLARAADDDEDDDKFTTQFRLQDCTFTPTGANAFFILKPGTRYVYEGTEDGAKLRLVITVTNRTRRVNGVETRVVEERESEDGELIEVSRNYFAICQETNSVFYFGEEVDIYEDGKIVSHDGAWLAGANGARAGLMMPGLALLGARYFQERAPDVAMDRAEIVSLSERVQTPAGSYRNVLKTEETSPLEPGHTSIKFYAPGVGLVQDGPVKLVSFSKG